MSRVAADGVSDDAAMFVGGRAEREMQRLVIKQMITFYAIASGPDIRVAGLHLLIHCNRATRADVQTGFLGQFDIRSGTQGENHQIRRIVSFGCCDLLNMAIFTADGQQRLAKMQLYPFFA